MTNITIPESVTKIGEWCFLFCLNLKNIVCLPTIPPTITNTLGLMESQDTIYVPSCSLDIYKTTDVWKDFVNIYPIEDTAISAINAENLSIGVDGGDITLSGLTDGEKVSFYSASGIPLGTVSAAGGTASLSTSATGIVIAKIGKQSIKIAVE